MRILQVVPTYWPAVRYGGPIVSIHALSKALVELGHEVEVYTTTVDGPGELDVPRGERCDVDGVGVTYFPTAAPRRLYRSPALGRAIDRATGQGVAGGARTAARFDVLHLHSVFLWPTLRAARAAERAGMPWVVSPRGMLVRDLVRARGRWRKAAWIRFCERRTLERAARIHATSDLEAKELLEFGVEWPPIEVVPNGVELPGPGPGEDDVPAGIRELGDGRPLLLFLGRLSWKKGLDLLLEACDELPGVTLAVAGPDDEDRARALAGRPNRGARVSYVGTVHGAARRFLLERAAALVLPSLNENFGNVVLEAMAHGTPVVCSPEVGASALVQRADAGLVVPRDASVLARALRDLLELAPEALREMGARGRLFVEGELTWPTVARRMVELYERAASPHGTERRAA